MKRALFLLGVTIGLCVSAILHPVQFVLALIAATKAARRVAAGGAV